MAMQLSVLPESLAYLWKKTLAEVSHQKIVERIWNKDYTVWKSTSDEISNRLGWLQSHEYFKDEWPFVESFVTDVREGGFQRAILLGMGGSSLAPEIFRRILGKREGYLDLTVCDTTAPDTISFFSRTLDVDKTLFIVSTKSGGTVETLSAMKYFFQQTCNVTGEIRAGRHFMAITDPGSSLEKEAKKHGFRHIFYGDPDIGGRYSSLSVFGLVPAALIGADVKKLVRKVADDHPNIITLGVKLGCMMGAGVKTGKNKLTFLLPDSLLPFGDWVEQLIAESTGKEGKGILPVVGEPLGQTGSYSPDRLFVAIRLQDDPHYDLTCLTGEKHPIAELVLEQIYDLGELLYVWEIATAVAGHIMGVNPFDQPDVEASKQFTRTVLQKIQDKEAEEDRAPLAHDQNMIVYGHGKKGITPEDALADFLGEIREGSYVAVQVFLAEDPVLSELFGKLRLAIRDRYRVATTVGYGPRFLHSTGQLHKGDDGSGMFIQFTADHLNDVFIPDDMTGTTARLTFGALQNAQALGDAKALEARHRRLLCIHSFTDPRGNIKRLIDSLCNLAI